MDLSDTLLKTAQQDMEIKRLFITINRNFDFLIFSKHVLATAGKQGLTVIVYVFHLFLIDCNYRSIILNEYTF